MAESPQTPPQTVKYKWNRFTKFPDFGAGKTFDLQKSTGNLAVAVNEQGDLITVPTFITSPSSLLSPGKVSAADIINTPPADTSAGWAGLATYSILYGLKGTPGGTTPYQSLHLNTDGGIGTVTGASPATLITAAGAGLKRRIFDLTIGSSLAGVVVIGDGVTIANVQVPAADSVSIRFGPNGILQPTANAAITATLAAATLTGTIITDGGS